MRPENRFHDQRQALYSEFPGHCLLIRESTRWLAQHYGLMPAQYIEKNRPDDVEHWMTRGRELLAAIDLVGGKQVVDRSTGMFGVALSGGLILSGPTPSRGREEVQERAKVAEKLFQESYC